MQAPSPAARPRRPQRLTRAAREVQLLDAAEACFADRGYDATSMEDVARAAGVSRPVVYEHHGSREGLLMGCVQRARQELEDAMTAALASIDPGASLAVVVERTSAAYYEMLERHPRRWALMFSSTTALSGVLADQLAELRTATVDRLVELFRPFVPLIDDERLRAYGHAVAGVAEQLGRWWLTHPELPRSRVEAYHRDFILVGVGVGGPGSGVGSSEGGSDEERRPPR